MWSATKPERIYNSHYAIGRWQFLHLSVVQLKSKHCRKIPHCHNGVVDTFGQSDIFISLVVFTLVKKVAKGHFFSESMMHFSHCPKNVQ